MKISDIEKKLINKNEISDDEIILLLDYIIDSVREIVNDYTFYYKCDLVQGLICDYLLKLNVKVYPCLTNHIIDPNVVGHSFTVAEFNSKKYIIDPSYVQFLYYDDKYKELSINNMRVASRSPFYYCISLNKDLTNDFVLKGYMELTEDSAFVFGNGFYQTKTSIPTDCCFSLIDGKTFIDKFLNGNEMLRFYGTESIEVKSNFSKKI